jgi:hypothetical protein
LSRSAPKADLRPLDQLFVQDAEVALDEGADLPAASLLDARMEAALLVSGGLFGLGFEVVPVGTDAERRRATYPSGPMRR